MAVSDDFFKRMWENNMFIINSTVSDENSLLKKCLDNLEITNIVATANLSVKDINLKKLAEENFFCNYHKCTFAAMGIRAKDGSAALLYSMGVMVCMGTTKTTQAMLACTRYCQILNNILHVPCHLTGFQVDNYVCTIFTFQLDLNACVREDWATVIEYDEEKFPGATVRCCFMGLDFETDVVMEFFKSGKINITGAKSIYEARCLFIMVFFKYIRHIRDDTRDRMRIDMKEEPLFLTDLQEPQVDTYEDELEKYRSFVRIKDENGNTKYMGDNNREIRIPSKYQNLPYDDIDLLVMEMGMKADF